MASAPSTCSFLSFRAWPLTGPSGLSTISGDILGPRIGRVTLARSGISGAAGSECQIEIPTPNLWTTTSRGVVPHLTRDNIVRSTSITGIHLTFESYLESDPPVPTLVPGLLPLHAFHGFNPTQHLLSFGLRDPNNAQELRANGNNYVIAQCTRGSKQVAPQQFHHWAVKLQPDIIFALPDIPYTPAPYSQKRLTKSNERSIRWLADLVILRETERPDLPVPKASDVDVTVATQGPAIFAHLLGGSVLAAREAFAESLLEPLTGRDASQLPTLESLDGAVSGYVLDLAPIRLSSVSLGQPAHPRAPLPHGILTPLIHASLRYLPQQKPRLVTGVSTPHEILRLIRSSGIDLFDSNWAQLAAHHGVVLDFRFPVSRGLWSEDQLSGFARPAAFNLYKPCFALDFSRLSDDFMSPWDAHQARNGEKVAQSDKWAVTNGDVLMCRCLACSPEVNAPIVHSAVESSHSEDTTTSPSQVPSRHFSRAYLHHLLHTHEMTAHTFLASHNLAVLDAFFSGIRSILAATADFDFSPSTERNDISAPAKTLFEQEVARFEHIYNESLLWGASHLHWGASITGGAGPPHANGDTTMGVLEDAEKHWREVEYLRGKGRLKREKEALVAAMGRNEN